MRGSAEGWARRPLGARSSRSPAPAGVGRRGKAVLKRRGSPQPQHFSSRDPAAVCSIPVCLGAAVLPPATSAPHLSAPAAACPLRSQGRGKVPQAQPRAQPPGLVPGAPALSPHPGGCGSAYPVLTAALSSPLGPHSFLASFLGP